MKPMDRRPLRIALVAALCFGTTSCSLINPTAVFTEPAADAGTRDAGLDAGVAVDAGLDSGAVATDAGPEDDDAGEGEVDAGAVDAGVEMDAGAPPRPDLVVTVDSAFWTGTRVSVTYTARNLGLAESGPFRVDLLVDRNGWFEDPPTPGEVGTPSMNESLLPGASRTVTERLSGTGNGLPTAWAVIDSLGEIVESDDANNVSLPSSWSRNPILITDTHASAVFEPIPDADAVTCRRSSITLPGGDNQYVSLSVSHRAIGDIFVELTAPNGETRRLFMNHGGDGDHMIATTFRDDATENVSDAAPPFSGEFQPATVWRTLPRSTDGTWTLRVCDTRAGVTGTFNQWSVTLLSEG